MIKRDNNLKTCIIFMCIFLFTTGCDQYTKQKILVFFFPPLGKERKVVIKKEEIEKTPQKIEKKGSPQLTYFVHGPKAQGKCDQCHELSGTYAFRKADTKGAGVPSIGEVSGRLGRLVMPLSELCMDCHISKSQKTAYSNKLWLHGPAAQGECTLCHQPHQSEFQYMLLKKNSIELCTECHAKGHMKENEKHKTDDECISCHNPHAGENSLLLKKDSNELF